MTVREVQITVCINVDDLVITCMKLGIIQEVRCVDITGHEGDIWVKLLFLKFRKMVISRCPGTILEHCKYILELYKVENFRRILRILGFYL